MTGDSRLGLLLLLRCIRGGAAEAGWWRDSAVDSHGGMKIRASLELNSTQRPQKLPFLACIQRTQYDGKTSAAGGKEREEQRSARQPVSLTSQSP